MTQQPIEKQTREFQTETKQLLDLMIHSIYTNREIFLRELISNASDAIDKVRVQSLTNQDLLEGDSNFEIFIASDETGHTLTLMDNGIGMTYDEVIENIGTIAKSGTKAFLEKLKEAGAAADSELIGQFGVGFYSAFMVAEKVTLITRAPGQNMGVRWESTGDGTYSIEPCDKDKRGTTLILTLKPEFRSKEQPSENFLNSYNLQSLVKKYSDYIRYPIKMAFTVKEKDEETKAETEKEEIRTLNSMRPLWVRPKHEITPEEYNQFYKDVFHDWQDPMEIIHTKAEGAVEFTTLLFIPSHAPFDFYQREATSGVRLYSKNVFVMDNYQDLLPEYLRFVKGLVDSPDFSLNISRELLQHSSQLKKIGKNLEKSVFKALDKMLTQDRAKYKDFWKEYGKAVKNGIYTDFSNREKLQELLLFPSSHSVEELTTLDEYVGRMDEKQTAIYYATGKDRTAVERLPQMELLREKGVEVLYFFDRVDEFAIDSLREFKGKKFQSVSRGDLKLDEEDENKKKDDAKANEPLVQAVKTQLGDKVSEVKISNRLKTSAVCLVSGDSGISLSMEQILAEMDKSTFKANRILELNPDHEIFTTLKNLHDTEPSSETFKDYCELLYGQALLMEGLAPDDPVGFADKVARLMVGRK